MTVHWRIKKVLLLWTNSGNEQGEKGGMYLVFAESMGHAPQHWFVIWEFKPKIQAMTHNRDYNEVPGLVERLPKFSQTFFNFFLFFFSKRGCLATQSKI